MLKGFRFGIVLLFGGLLLAPTLLIGQDRINSGELGGGELNTIKTAVAFLSIAPDSRAGAMGDVGAATTPDVNAQHWNIGKYAFIEKDGGFAISYTPWLRNLIPDINLAYLSGYYRLDDKQVVSGSLRYFSLGNIVFTNIVGDVTGQYNPNEFAVDAGYSRLFTDNFSGGIAFRFIRSDLTAGQNSADGQETQPGISFAADLGFYYQNEVDLGTSDGEWALGASITNMGTPLSYTADAEKTPIPTNLRLGGRLTYNIDDYNSITGSVDLNKLLVPTSPVLDDSIFQETGEEVVLRGKEAPGSVVMGMVQSFYDAPGVPTNNGYTSDKKRKHEDSKDGNIDGNIAGGHEFQQIQLLVSLAEAASYFILPGLGNLVFDTSKEIVEASPSLSFNFLQACKMAGPSVLDRLVQLAVGLVRKTPMERITPNLVACLSADVMEEILKDSKMEMTEFELFLVLTLWVEAADTDINQEDRKQTAMGLSKHICLNKIDPDILSTTVTSSGLFTSEELFETYKYQALITKQSHLDLFLTPQTPRAKWTTWKAGNSQPPSKTRVEGAGSDEVHHIEQFLAVFHM